MKILQKITVFYLGFLSMILPLKFASLVMMPEATGYFPSELWEYLIVNFPGMSAGVATGIGLLLTITAFGGEFFRRKICLNWSLIGWILAFAASNIGFFNASTYDYPLMATTHIAAFLAYAFSIYIYFKTNDDVFERILCWWTVGLLLVLANGLYQYFLGFDEQLAFYYSESGRAANIDNVDLSAKMVERRIFATFGGSNVLAGFLMLTGAIGFYIMYQWAGNFAPPKQSRFLLCGIFSAAALWVLINTGSRGALAAGGGALIYALFYLNIDRKYKISGVLIMLLLIGMLIFSSIFFGRTFGSFTERLGYWRSAFLMMGENWYSGSGWGDFFVDNMRFRIIDLEETARGPHNLFLIFGCSCGVFAMLAVMFASLWALYRASLKFLREKTFLNCVIMLALAAFLIHAMLDVNFQIAASMGIFCTLTLFAADDGEFELKFSINKAALYVFFVLIALYAILNSVILTQGEKAYDKFKTDIHMTLRENKFTTAHIMQDYLEVEKYRPYSPFHAMDMYYYFSALNNNDSALEYLEIALKRSPERAGYYYAAAAFYLRQGNIAKAAEYIKTARKLYPRSKKYRVFEENLKKSSNF